MFTTLSKRDAGITSIIGVVTGFTYGSTVAFIDWFNFIDHTVHATNYEDEYVKISRPSTLSTTLIIKKDGLNVYLNGNKINYTPGATIKTGSTGYSYLLTY